MLLTLSPLAHTWIIDIDGTLCEHNGYKNGADVLLPGVADFFAKLSDDDFVIFVTSRTEGSKEQLEKFLAEHGIRCNKIIYGVPYGERILINDRKPSGLTTAIAINKERDSSFDVDFRIDQRL